MTNPILSYRCLNELCWLSSSNVEQYIEELKLDNSLKSKLILLYHYESDSDQSNLKELLHDRELLTSIFPEINVIDAEGEASSHLFAFENYITELYNNKRRVEFENLAKEFFKNFKEDTSVDKEHSEFIKHMNGN